ncbi:MAG: DUF2723 domain-containing protein [Candidatus Marinimicrobia bacterium]|nr:DUF2723 domain-containing protein [Candidatus Neomarinimicrobiota bacterium]
MKLLGQKHKQNSLKIILASLSFLIAYLVKMATVAPTVSFWDCGEFIATSYILGVPHPPGTPLYLLISRIFSMLPLGSNVGFRVNLISPLVSSLTILFLFLIIVKFLKRYVNMDDDMNRLSVYFGAFIGALTFAFTDSHWFNSVEAEVYAFSTFLTSLVMWLTLKWEENAGRAGHERYLLFIAYIIGLSIGIHLLSLLIIFVIAVIMYFKYYEISSIWWMIGDILIGAAIAGILFYVIYSSVPNPDQNMLLIGLITLGLFTGGYFLLNKYAGKNRYQEHSANVFMAFFASLGFLIVNSGVIRGIPKIIDNWGIAGLVISLLLLVIITIWALKNQKNIVALILASIILVIVGYSTFTMIFIRSNQDPAIDENNPETIERFISYLEREQYGRRSFADIFDRKKSKTLASKAAVQKYQDKSDLYFFWDYQIKKMYIRYFLWQFVGREGAKVDPFQFLLPLPLLIGLYGALSHFGRDKKHALAVLALFLFTGFMIILYLNQKDPQPRERDYSYTGSFFAFSIWIGVGAAELIRKVKEFKWAKLKKPMMWGAATLLIVALPLNLLLANYNSHDRSGNYVAWDYAYNLLNTCEKDGILFTNGDNDTFPLWYLQQVEKVRTDVKVVNLSLLRTHWYIKQLRDFEPKIKIGLTDRQIERSLRPQRWETRTVKASTPDSLPPMQWKMKPTIQNRAIGVHHLMIWQLIQSNNWERPIYFAITLASKNYIGLRDANYLQLEGLAYRLKPYKVDHRLNLDRMQKNLLGVYRYRNLNNPDVYFSGDAKQSVSYYRSVFFQLALRRLRNNNYQDVVEILETLETNMPESILPMRTENLSVQISMLYEQALKELADQTEKDYEELRKEYNGPDKASNKISAIINQENMSLDKKLQYTKNLMYGVEDYKGALRILEEIQEKQVNNPQVLSLQVRAYRHTRQYDKAINILEKWLEDHPQDQNAKRMLSNLEARQEKQNLADTSS